MIRLALITAILLLYTFGSYGQFGGCDCAQAIDEDLKTDFSSFNRNALKSFLEDYIFSNQKQRKKLKKSSSFGLNIIVENIPIDFSASSDNKSSAMFSIEKEVKRTRIVTDEHINTIITSFLPDRSFDSFDKCLDDCLRYHEIINKNGLKVTAIEETEEIVTLQISWNSSPAGRFITIENADYTNGVALHGKKLQSGRRINDGQIIIETIKRDQTRDLVIVVNFAEGNVGFAKKKFRAPIRTANENVPIGTIIASVLDYDTFLDVNGVKDDNFDIETSTWAPCDGRAVAASKYGKKRTNVPDLRGLFLRGINDMGISGADSVEHDQLNVQDLSAGIFQPDSFEKHKHTANLRVGAEPQGGGARRQDAAGGHGAIRPTWVSTGLVNNTGEGETRPKNMTVFYYIRIN